jgi:outer membrane protein OmpA-like peptidoglycan-associated protein
MKTPIRLPLLLLSTLVGLPAWADEAVDVSLTPRAILGKGLPMVTLHINERIAGFRLKLQRSDGKSVDVKGGGRPGQVRNVDLAQPEGTFKYKGELTVNLPNGDNSAMPLEFEASLYGPLRITVDKKDVDVPGRKLKFTLNHPVAKAHLRVVLDSGKLAIDDDVNFNSEAPGTPLELSWPAGEGNVMLIDLKGFDPDGFFNGVELSPWQVDIPHEEVNFDTGKWDIRPDQESKLDKSYRLISDAVEKFGQLAEIKLYVAGHTDTVGTNEHNRSLSLNRARSLCGYFRKRGLRVPIFYEGFGEEALLVGTPDETDEPRNRRAEYIIAIDKPTVAHAPFEANWRKL